ncbi:unnamed protein product, partial [Hapterophycus canaliculatus]
RLWAWQGVVHFLHQDYGDRAGSRGCCSTARHQKRSHRACGFDKRFATKNKIVLASLVHHGFPFRLQFAKRDDCVVAETCRGVVVWIKLHREAVGGVSLLKTSYCSEGLLASGVGLAGFVGAAVSAQPENDATQVPPSVDLFSLDGTDYHLLLEMTRKEFLRGTTSAVPSPEC